jgi:hypothetical protein
MIKFTALYTLWVGGWGVVGAYLKSGLNPSLTKFLAPEILKNPTKYGYKKRATGGRFDIVNGALKIPKNGGRKFLTLERPSPP